MDFALSDTQQMIRDAAESFLAEVADSTAVRAAMSSDSGCNESVWRKLATDLGWCALNVPEEQGGLGLGPVELVLVLEQCGRRLLPAPLFSTVGVATTILLALADDASQARILPRIAAGKLRLTAAVIEQDPRALHAELRDGAWLLNGRVEHLPDAQLADGFLLRAAVGDDFAWFFVPQEATGLRICRSENWDLSRRVADLELADVAVDQRCDDPARRIDGEQRALALARLYLAAEQLGAARQSLDLTVNYVSERKQFGRAVGSFQAVKHRCAEMMVAVEALCSAVYGAAALAAAEPPLAELARECAMARALAAEIAPRCAGEAIQLHGGVGFTWEYDPQLYFKRARAVSHWFGDATALRAEIAAAVMDAA